MKRVIKVITAGVVFLSLPGILCAAEAPNPAPASAPAVTATSDAHQKAVKKLRDRNIKAKAKSGTGRSKSSLPSATQRTDTKKADKLIERNQNAKENAKNLGVGSGTGSPQNVK